MKIKDYFAGKRSRVADWYTQDTSDIPLYCKVTDKVLDMIVTLSDPREASLAVVDENNHVVGIVTGRDIVLYMGTHRVIEENLTVDAVMTENPKTGTPEMLCIDALKIMIEGRFRNLPDRSRWKIRRDPFDFGGCQRPLDGNHGEEYRSL
jgi:CBS-domain-containing membrane protein